MNEFERLRRRLLLESNDSYYVIAGRKTKFSEKTRPITGFQVQNNSFIGGGIISQLTELVFGDSYNVVTAIDFPSFLLGLTDVKHLDLSGLKNVTTFSGDSALMNYGNTEIDLSSFTSLQDITSYNFLSYANKLVKIYIGGIDFSTFSYSYGDYKFDGTKGNSGTIYANTLALANAFKNRYNMYGWSVAVG